MTTYSKMLFASMEDRQFSWNLTSTAPLWKITHPVLLKLKAEQADGHVPDARFRTHHWNLNCYSDAQEAEARHTHLKGEIAFPWVIGKFLQEMPEEALLHFPDLGSVYLTVQPLAPQSPTSFLHAQLPAFLDYALSAELWGPAGKWTRFHQTLHTLFEKYGLLIGQDHPGHYTLTAAARMLEQHGFSGELHGDHVTWILPWDFPLSAIRKVEAALTQE